MVVVAGDFMIRIAKSADLGDDARVAADVAEIERHLAPIERKLAAARKKLAADPTDAESAASIAKLQGTKAQLEAKRATAQQPERSKGAVGVTIGVRDTIAKGHAFKKGAPGVVLIEKKVIVTSSLDDLAKAGATTMTLEDEQFVVRRNHGADKEVFGLPKKGGFAAVDHTGKSFRLHEGAFRAQVDEFSINGDKIQLG